MPEQRRDYLLHHARPAGDALVMATHAIEASGAFWISDGLQYLIHNPHPDPNPTLESIAGVEPEEVV